MGFFLELLRSIWDFIKRIFVRVINFTRNIVSFFKDPNRLRKLKEDSNKIAVSVKQNLDNGNYKVVNCLFDKSSNTVVDLENQAMGIEAEDIDVFTEEQFGGKDMIILS